jgi:hypothetical protein
MSANEIRNAVFEAGKRGDTEAFALLCMAHGFVVRNPNSKRNIGRLPVDEMLAVYGRGVRARFAA